MDCSSHPPHTTHLAPSDFNLFRALKHATHGWFRSDAESTKLKLLKNRIVVFVSRWHKAVEVDGEYVAKQSVRYSHLVIL
jgi:hypothetical protein